VRYQFQLFNEAELLAELNPETESDSTEVKGHRRQKHKSSHALPAHLPRVDVVHDLDEHLKQCDLIRHRRKKYACSCKQCIRTASMPIQPLPRSQASPQVIADAMVSKYRDGIPLYRQEKIAARVDVPLPRGKLARWIIDGSEVFHIFLLRHCSEEGALQTNRWCWSIMPPPNQDRLPTDYLASSGGHWCVMVHRTLIWRFARTG